MNPEQEAAAVGQLSEERFDPFTQDDLSDKWRKFAYSIKLKDLDLYSTLTANPPVLKDNFIVELTIFNSAQEADVNAKKAELLGYLRKQLNNTAVDLTLVIDKEAESKGVYTVQDKYKKLVEKNPSVDALRKRFGLNF